MKGDKGDTWTLAANPGTGTLTRTGGTQTMAFSGVTLSSASGTFTGSGSQPSSPTLYLGLTVALGNSTSNPAGSCTGNVYAVTFLPTSLQLSGPGGATMTLGSFTSNPGPTGTLGAGGSQTLTVGGSLTVKANQAPGDYTGSFTVQVTYQ